MGMAWNTVNTTVSIASRFLRWASGINAPRNAAIHWPSRWPIGIDRDELYRLFEQAITDDNRDLDDEIQRYGCCTWW